MDGDRDEHLIDPSGEDRMDGWVFFVGKRAIEMFGTLNCFGDGRIPDQMTPLVL
jgi:hypothetical protein